MILSAPTPIESERPLLEIWTSWAAALGSRLARPAAVGAAGLMVLEAAPGVLVRVDTAASPASFLAGMLQARGRTFDPDTTMFVFCFIFIFLPVYVSFFLCIRPGVLASHVVFAVLFKERRA